MRTASKGYCTEAKRSEKSGLFLLEIMQHLWEQSDNNTFAQLLAWFHTEGGKFTTRSDAVFIENATGNLLVPRNMQNVLIDMQKDRKIRYNKQNKIYILEIYMI